MLNTVATPGLLKGICVWYSDTIQL